MPWQVHSPFRCRRPNGANTITNAINTARREAKEEGLAEGMERGLAVGIEKAHLETVRKMKEKGFDNKEIAELTGLSEHEIRLL